MNQCADFQTVRRGNGRWLMRPPGDQVDSVLIVLVEAGSAEVQGRRDALVIERDNLLIVPRHLFDSLTVHTGSTVVETRISGNVCHLPTVGYLLATTSEPGTVAALLRHVLVGLSNDTRVQRQLPSSRGLHQIGELVAAAVAERGHTPESDNAGLFGDARRYIEDRLYDATLGQDQISAALHVSTRTLHRVFRSQGSTVGAWIRERRLEQCRIDLSDSGLSHVSVSALGARWGLVDAAHFSRLFKARYGLAPRDFRASSLSLSRIDGGRSSVLAQLPVAG